VFDASRRAAPVPGDRLRNFGRESPLRFELPGGTAAPAAARQVLDGLSLTLDDETYEDLRLLISELVTNSVRHGRADVEGSVEMTVDVSSRRIRVEVTDTGPGFIPEPPRPAPDGAGGWGLVFVDLVADRWAAVPGRAPRDSRVWFEIDVPRSRPSAGREAVFGRDRPLSRIAQPAW
jgi:two-component sensor histidine kinase